MRGFWVAQAHLMSSVVTAPIVLETGVLQRQRTSVAGAKPREERKGVLERCWRPQKALGLSINFFERLGISIKLLPSLGGGLGIPQV